MFQVSVKGPLFYMPTNAVLFLLLVLRHCIFINLFKVVFIADDSDYTAQLNEYIPSCALRPILYFVYNSTIKFRHLGKEEYIRWN
jgi:hypothetical protein